MPVAPGTPINTQATRAKLLDAARDLFFQRGVHAVGISELAKAAEASKLTIYRHFGSKGGLVRALLERTSDDIHATTHERLSRVPEGRERVLALFDLLASDFREDSFCGCPVINATTDLRADRDPITPITVRHLQRYLDLLETNLLAAGAREPAALARRLLILVEGATVLSAIRPWDVGDDARTSAKQLLDAAIAAGPEPA